MPFQRPFARFALALALTIAIPIAPQPAHADETAEARLYFERGNGLLRDALRLRGARRTRMLEQALTEYVASLRIVRNANALFNTAQALAELQRYDEAFAYYVEYRGIPGVQEADLAEATRRIDALRPRVAVIAVESPAGAEVYIDRRDAAARRGAAPVEVAVPPGEHVVWVTREGYASAEQTVTAGLGERAAIQAELTALPIDVRVIADEGVIAIDGQAVASGTAAPLQPGAHVATLTIGEQTVAEERFELAPGDGARTIELGPPEIDHAGTGQVLVVAGVRVEVASEGVVLGEGRAVRVDLPSGRAELRVTSRGHDPLDIIVNVLPGRELTVHARMTPIDDGETTLGPAPYIAGIAAGVAGAFAVGLSINAGVESDRFDDTVDMPTASREAQETAADDLDQANLLADIAWGATALFGATTIILALVNEDVERSPSTATLSVAPLPDGALVVASHAMVWP